MGSEIVDSSEYLTAELAWSLPFARVRFFVPDNMLLAFKLHVAVFKAFVAFGK